MGNPITQERWNVPCGPRGSVRPPMPPQGEIVNDLVMRLLELEENVEYLKHRYEVERVQSAALISFLDKTHLEGLNDEVQNSTLIDDINDESIRTLRVVAVFLSQMKTDEQLKEHGLFLKDIDNVQNKLYDVLCHIEMLIEQSENVLPLNVSSDILPAEIRQLKDRSTRHHRDYIIVKDFDRLLQEYITLYRSANRNVDQ